MSRMVRMALVVTVAVVAAAACVEQEPAEKEMDVDTAVISVANEGFDTPESVLHDPEADVYLVSNISGAPTAVDGNGYISRVAPDGEVLDLRWIDGQMDAVTLNAPKGMAIRGDTLYVTDITAVRAFHRTTGAPLGSWAVEGSTFLNDLAVGPDGTLYVSDSGLNPDFSSSGTDAIYRFEDGEPVTVVRDTALAAPNGLAVTETGVIFVSFGAPLVRSVAADGSIEVIAELPAGQLDGVEVLANGAMLVSSWEASAVYRVPVEGEASLVIERVPSPADIGWDTDRSRVLIPIFNENRLRFEAVDVDAEPAPMEQQPRY